jgi:hypothetical protein
MKRLRQFFESIVYAGMKPGAPSAQKSSLRWLGPLQGPVQRFLNGSASTDPLYLTNRTLGHKVRLGLLICIPFALVLAFVGFAALGRFDDPDQLPPPTKQLTNAEIAAKMLPDLNKDLTLETNKELQVVEVEVQQIGGSRISGSVKNNTDHLITDAEVIFDLTNTGGSRVGAVSCKIARVEPKSTAPFQTAIPQADAAFAVVREVHNH